MLRGFPFRKKRQRPPRQDLFEAVEIEVGKGIPPVRGILKDISETGALIHVDEADQLPRRVRLAIHDLKILTEADIRWRREEKIGVRFVERIDLNAVPKRRRNDRRQIIAGQFRPRSKDHKPASAG